MDNILAADEKMYSMKIVDLTGDIILNKIKRNLEDTFACRHLFLSFVAVSFLSVFFTTSAYAFVTDQNARTETGQNVFYTHTAATTQSGLSNPVGLSFDSSGNLWVADYNNNRVLEYTCTATSSCANGNNAALEIGQPAGGTQFTTSTGVRTQSGLNGPDALSFDSSGNLWVAEYSNSRMLQYTCTATSSCANGNNAALVIGQSGFTSGSGATTQSGLRSPSGLSFDSSGNLWMADYNNNRVLEFSSQVAAQASASTTISSGGATSDQTGTTGVKVTIIGSSSPNTTPFTITTQQLAVPYTLVSTPSLSGTKYFDVLVGGLADGNARICVNDPQADASTILQYWTGTSWQTAADFVSNAGVNVCGTIPASSLGGTNIVVGDPPSSGHGGSAPGGPPSFTTGFTQDQYPLTINSNNYKLPNYTNTGPTSAITLGVPFTIKIMLYGDFGPSSVKHVSLFTNIRGNYASIVNADTIISWDASVPLLVVDPHHFFGLITANATVVGNKFQVTFYGTFVKPMPLSDIGIRTWGYDTYSQDIYVINVLQSTNLKTQSNVSTNAQTVSINPSNGTQASTNTASTPTTNSGINTAANTPANDLVTSVREWAGYSPAAISDSQMLQSMGYQGTHIPPWVMKNMARYLVDGTITQDEFAGAIKYLHDNHIIK